MNKSKKKEMKRRNICTHWKNVRIENKELYFKGYKMQNSVAFYLQQWLHTPPSFEYQSYCIDTQGEREGECAT